MESLEDEKITIINSEEKDYYGKLYRVCVWCGYGYVLNVYYVYYGEIDEGILEKVVTYAEKNDTEILLDVDSVYADLTDCYKDEYEEYLEENPENCEEDFISNVLDLIYVDATMEGASQPYYIRAENLRIEEVNENLKEENKNGKNF